MIGGLPSIWTLTSGHSYKDQHPRMPLTAVPLFVWTFSLSLTDILRACPCHGHLPTRFLIIIFGSKSAHVSPRSTVSQLSNAQPPHFQHFVDRNRNTPFYVGTTIVTCGQRSIWRDQGATFVCSLCCGVLWCEHWKKYCAILFWIGGGVTKTCLKFSLPSSPPTTPLQKPPVPSLASLEHDKVHKSHKEGSDLSRQSSWSLRWSHCQKVWNSSHYCQTHLRFLC